MRHPQPGASPATIAARHATTTIDIPRCAVTRPAFSRWSTTSAPSVAWTSTAARAATAGHSTAGRSRKRTSAHPTSTAINVLTTLATSRWECSSHTFHSV